MNEAASARPLQATASAFKQPGRASAAWTILRWVATARQTRPLGISVATSKPFWLLRKLGGVWWYCETASPTLHLPSPPHPNSVLSHPTPNSVILSGGAHGFTVSTGVEEPALSEAEGTPTQPVSPLPSIPFPRQSPLGTRARKIPRPEAQPAPSGSFDYAPSGLRSG